MIDTLLSWFGLMRSSRFTEMENNYTKASGALADINILVTSCVNKKAASETLSIAQSVLNRSLSARLPNLRHPSYFKHDWEEFQWNLFYPKL